MPIVEAKGMASTRHISADIESAMSAAIGEAEAEVKKINEDPKLDVKEKHAQIAAIMNPVAIRERKLQARQRVKDEARKMEGDLVAEKLKGMKGIPNG